MNFNFLGSATTYTP